MGSSRRHISTRLAASLAVGLAAFLTAGCGSSSSGQSTKTTPTLSASASTDSQGSPGAASSPSGHASPGSKPTAASTPPQPPPHGSASGHITAQANSAGTFQLAPSDCGGSGSYAFFHFGTPGSGEEARIDVSTGYRGPGTYGPGTFGVSASVSHQGQLWIVNFQSSSNATLTIDPGAATGRVTFASQGGTGETISAQFSC